MAILSGDVKLLKSAVMADVPEGGGAPTGNAIVDGVSNAIFPDISEVARAGGQVSMRKVFASVHTDDTDTYFGANVIVAEPPQDPRVSVTMFGMGATFDTRSSATARVESYLNRGAEWPGYLYENHIAGQKVIQLFQRPDTEIIRVGHTIVLVKDEGKSSEAVQYIRATSVEAVVRSFYDPSRDADYQAMVVTVNISDALRYDFTGSPASRTFAKAANATVVRDTVVSDAGVYAGAVPLATEANLSYFTVNVETIYTQLVPSAQIETPIVDVTMAGVTGSLVQTGATRTLTLTCVFTTTQKIFVGMGIYPGSLTLTRSGLTITDSGGILYSAGSQCGTIDYGGGILALATNIFGGAGGTHSIVFTPAYELRIASQTQSVAVTPESRSLSYVITLEELPSPATLSVAYMTGGRWYVLHDNGAGELRGVSPSYGVGTLNLTTGSVVVTLGALPDVGSIVIFTYCEA